MGKLSPFCRGCRAVEVFIYTPGRAGTLEDIFYGTNGSRFFRLDIGLLRCDFRWLLLRLTLTSL